MARAGAPAAAVWVRACFVFLVWTVGVLVPSAGRTVEAAGEGDIQAGRALYREGRTAEQGELAALTAGDVRGAGRNFACVNCHRPSGLGGSEGNKYVLPITGSMLFAPRELDRNRVFGKLFLEARTPEFTARMRQARMRPAYTPQTLARALREGLDPTGRALDPVMPRYEISDLDLTNLIAYLCTLSAQPDPGVDAETLHVATVVSDTVDPARRAAMLEVMQAYIGRLNLALSNDRSRGQFSPYYRSELIGGFRRWQLHVWELAGPAHTWSEQLAQAYRKQPVFVMLSGLVDGPWRAVADFCDRERLPCLFPNTELPRTEDAADAYSFYFSRGLELEAQVLALHLAGGLPASRTIAQISVDEAQGSIPARAFAALLGQRFPALRLDSIRVVDPAALRAAIGQVLHERPEVGALAIWPGRHAAAAAAALRDAKARAATVALPSSALGVWTNGAEAAAAATKRDAVVFAYPYELPTVDHPRTYLVHAWMRTYGIALTYPRLQLQTYYAMTLAEAGIGHLVGDYFRDYFAEFVEAEAESHLNPGTHPALALGPGQRFASKGAFVVVPDAAKGVRALSAWIIP